MNHICAQFNKARLAEESEKVQIISTLDFFTTLRFVVAKSRSHEPVVNALMQEVRILWCLGL
ncbi:MAG: hypothetical protein ACJAVV_000073 [Alphaproteobacteria bacterium]|jgi:hypothetical protein